MYVVALFIHPNLRQTIMPEYITPDELNGFERRLNEVCTSLAGCQGQSRARMDAMEKEQNRTGENIDRLFVSIDALRQQSAVTTTRMTIIVGAIVVVGQAVIPMLLNLLKSGG